MVTSNGSSSCAGLFKLVNIPTAYECKDQRGKVKCVKDVYSSTDDCKKSCPGSCQDKECFVANTVD